MCAIFPWAGVGALTHCDGSRPTPQTKYACVRVFGVLGCTLIFNVEGIGWVILLCSDDVRLGIGKGLSSAPLVTGRSALLSEVRGRTKDDWLRSDGDISSVDGLDGRRARKLTAAAVAALTLLAAAPSDEDEGDILK